MFDAYNTSQVEDVPDNGFEDSENGRNLAFEDRIYKSS